MWTGGYAFTVVEIQQGFFNIYCALEDPISIAGNNSFPNSLRNPVHLCVIKP